MFVFFWGLNYARLPLKDSMHLDVTEYSKEELAELTYDLVASTNAARKNVSQNADGTFSLSHSKEYYQKPYPAFMTTMRQNT